MGVSAYRRIGVCGGDAAAVVITQLKGGRAAAPKGLEDLAQGFNPGSVVPAERALKVAPEGVRRGRWEYSFDQSTPICCHFQGTSLLTHNPGLKPWAKSCCPFGAAASP